MITTRGAVLLTGAVLLWGLGRLLGVPELYVVSVTSAAAVGLGVVAVRMTTATVALRRDVSTNRLLHGSSADVRVDLRNDGRLPAPLLLVEDDCPHALLDHGAAKQRTRFVVSGLRPGQTVSLSYATDGTVRGRYVVGPVRLVVRDPFGLAQRSRRYRSTDEVIVYPRVEALPEGATRGTHHGTGSSQQRRLFSTGDEFYTMREYVQGDDLRLIHWPSTARRQLLMVRQQELPWQAQATVFCDTRARAHRGLGVHSTLEVAVSAAASVVWHLADRSYRLRLCTERDGRPPQPTDWPTILDQLAVVESSRIDGLGPALSRFRGSGAEGLLVAIVAPPPGDGPVPAHPDALALLAAGRAFTDRIAVVVDVGGPARPRAAALAGLLRTGGWRTLTLAPGQRLSDRWSALVAGRRRTALAYIPGGSEPPAAPRTPGGSEPPAAPRTPGGSEPPATPRIPGTVR